MMTTDQEPASAGSILTNLLKVVRAVDKLSFLGIVLAVGLMTSLVAIQVFVRYVLGSSIDSADELSRVFFVWAIFLAIPHGIKTGIHVSIEALVIRFSQRVQELLFRLMSFFSALLMIVVFYAAYFVMLDKWQELLPTVEVTAAVFYIAVLICAGHSFLHLIVHAMGGSKVWDQQKGASQT